MSAVLKRSDRMTPAQMKLLQAMSFAARAHHGQMRKDRQTPYFSHVARVGMIARDIFGIDDPQVLTAAVLHDTVEDTTTDHDDIAEHFGTTIADWVAALSKDKRLAEAEREHAYEQCLANAPWQVQICKLADIVDNVIDSQSSEKIHARALQNAKRYLKALKSRLCPEAQKSWEFVSQLVSSLDGSKE